MGLRSAHTALDMIAKLPKMKYHCSILACLVLSPARLFFVPLAAPLWGKPLKTPSKENIL
jgi:hypothetical protein